MDFLTNYSNMEVLTTFLPSGWFWRSVAVYKVFRVKLLWPIDGVGGFCVLVLDDFAGRCFLLKCWPMTLYWSSFSSSAMDLKCMMGEMSSPPEIRSKLSLSLNLIGKTWWLSTWLPARLLLVLWLVFFILEDSVRVAIGCIWSPENRVAYSSLFALSMSSLTWRRFSSSIFSLWKNESVWMCRFSGPSSSELVYRAAVPILRPPLIGYSSLLSETS